MFGVDQLTAATQARPATSSRKSRDQAELLPFPDFCAINWARGQRSLAAVKVGRKHRQLLTFLALYRNRHTGQCNPGQAALMVDMDCTKPTLIRLTRDLESLGLIRCHRRWHAAMSYTLCMDVVASPEAVAAVLGGPSESDASDTFTPPVQSRVKVTLGPSESDASVTREPVEPDSESLGRPGAPPKGAPASRPCVRSTCTVAVERGRAASLGATATPAPDRAPRQGVVARSVPPMATAEPKASAAHGSARPPVWHPGADAARLAVDTLGGSLADLLAEFGEWCRIVQRIPSDASFQAWCEDRRQTLAQIAEDDAAEADGVDVCDDRAMSAWRAGKALAEHIAHTKAELADLGAELKAHGTLWLANNPDYARVKARLERLLQRRDMLRATVLH